MRYSRKIIFVVLGVAGLSAGVVFGEEDLWSRVLALAGLSEAAQVEKKIDEICDNHSVEEINEGHKKINEIKDIYSLNKSEKKNEKKSAELDETDKGFKKVKESDQYKNKVEQERKDKILNSVLLSFNSTASCAKNSINQTVNSHKELNNLRNKIKEKCVELIFQHEVASSDCEDSQKLMKPTCFNHLITKVNASVKGNDVESKIQELRRSEFNRRIKSAFDGKSSKPLVVTNLSHFEVHNAFRSPGSNSCDVPDLAFNEETGLNSAKESKQQVANKYWAKMLIKRGVSSFEKPHTVFPCDVNGLTSEASDAVTELKADLIKFSVGNLSVFTGAECRDGSLALEFKNKGGLIIYVRLSIDKNNAFELKQMYPLRGKRVFRMAQGNQIADSPNLPSDFNRGAFVANRSLCNN